jgi:peptide/nickel transport system ATP-binding protein
VSVPPLLSVRDLSVAIAGLPVLDRASFDVQAGETLALVGESGAGKSLLALTLLRLAEPAARITGGQVRLDGVDLLGVNAARMRALRGGTLALVFQHPARALNPIRPVGRQIADVLRAHGRVSAGAAEHHAETLLAQVGIAEPAARARAYPFELSGGTCQRVMIALALAASPRLLIADEPTTGLDETAQTLVLDLLAALARQRGMATLLITHDLAMAAQRCQRIAVLHAGQLVELAEAATLLAQPRHPYTRALLRATPHPGGRLNALVPIPGGAPDLSSGDLPACRFFDRCAYRTGLCRSVAPPVRAFGAAQRVACHHPQ